MISQDRHEVYLLFGRYDENYISYIRDEPWVGKMTCLVTAPDGRSSGARVPEQVGQKLVGKRAETKGKSRKRGRKKRLSKSKDDEPPLFSRVVQDDFPIEGGSKSEDVKGEYPDLSFQYPTNQHYSLFTRFVLFLCSESKG